MGALLGLRLSRYCPRGAIRALVARIALWQYGLFGLRYCALWAQYASPIALLPARGNTRSFGFAIAMDRYHAQVFEIAEKKSYFAPELWSLMAIAIAKRAMRILRSKIASQTAAYRAPRRGGDIAA